MGTFTDSEDPYEMPHNAAFHKGLHCLYVIFHHCLHYLYRLKKSLNKSENYNLTSLVMYNGLSQVYCIKQEGNIH